MRRGEVWWAELASPAGRRPVLLLSRNDAYDVRELVTVAPVATRIRHIPSKVPLSPEDGLPPLLERAKIGSGLIKHLDEMSSEGQI